MDCTITPSVPQLYDPNLVKDNCGFGLIAQQDGSATHHLVKTAITALSRMTHRGAIAADGKTGDGCGIIMQQPKDFFQRIAKEKQFQLSKTFAVGVLFTHPDKASHQKQLDIVNKTITKYGLTVSGLRPVPTNQAALGRIAAAALPKIHHIFISTNNKDENTFEQELFRVRKALEGTINDQYFYIPSLSCRTIVYKALVMPAELPIFYPDLTDQDLKSAICIFHQRFSTNTLPDWRLAQPFRYLAHNGEINTIMGNRMWAKARTNKFKNQFLSDPSKLAPIVNFSGSDSSSLDNMLELLLMGGMSLTKALRLLVPPAWQNEHSMDARLRAFFEYFSSRMEPWDGPAGLVITDGRYAVCALDRNGLRPARYVKTTDGLITLASEIGVYDYAASDVIEKGRIGPGQILAIDTRTNQCLTTDDINEQLKHEHPYREWLKTHSQHIFSKLIGSTNTVARIPPEEYSMYFKLYQVTFEEKEEILRPLGETANEPVSSMGDDTPMAVLSRQIRPIYDYFRQQFAQVTNPPIDPLRESIVMSLETCFGAEPNFFAETAESAKRIVVDSPILSFGKFTQLIEQTDPNFKVKFISLNIDINTKLQDALTRICNEAQEAVQNGCCLIVLSDRNISQTTYPVHAALATGAVHHHLINAGVRCDANIIVETASARSAHHFAVLIGYGATAVYPYLAYEVFRDLKATGQLSIDAVDAIKNYRRGIEKALLKILSKMGIATIASYRGAQLFELVGINDDICKLCFNGSRSKIQGASFEDLYDELLLLVQQAYQAHTPIAPGGLLKYIHGQEYHAFEPEVVTELIKAARTGEQKHYTAFSRAVNERPIAMLRDLMALKTADNPLKLAEVEPTHAVLSRFDTAGMSLGALSPEAHEALAIAMSQLGGRSNSGEGGEDPKRYNTNKNSKIKQIASGRFGVTPDYLMSAEVIQIKIAQGAKPGEGGQLPGHKVTPLIAKLRYSVPGVTLISPPPHHDIYSIEDLAQLIFDLKQLNPSALISVKLVAAPGVGTIAVGVAKAYADLITISGYDGGTAASPISSIKYAGSPWEMGLVETHQALLANNLRHKIRLQADGGLKTGLDVIKAAILGAESFGFGTAPMVALGCKYLRICHLNNCATGVATQDDYLRHNHFVGTPEMAVNYFKFVAEETREWLSKLGASSIAEIIGKVELLERIPGETSKQKNLDLSALLTSIKTDETPYCTVTSNVPFDKGELAENILTECQSIIEADSGGIFHYPIKNYHRSIGAKLSGQIAKKYGKSGLKKPLTIHFEGTAGQSFGAFNIHGLHLILEGDANDYVGKGMAGGKIVLYPPTSSVYSSKNTPIAGNTCLYGATGGKFYAAGRAGERFAVRNSGAMVVIEGMGDHGCEYMTGGVVVSLGAVGHNFGAGMTGGFAYILDIENEFVDRFNQELIEIYRINIVDTGAHRAYLRNMVQDFYDETKSKWGKTILEDYEDFLRHFWLVKPKAASFDGLFSNLKHLSA